GGVDREDAADLPRVAAGGGGGDVDEGVAVAQRGGGGGRRDHPAVRGAADEVEAIASVGREPHGDRVRRRGAALGAGETVVRAAVGERRGGGGGPGAADGVEHLLERVGRLTVEGEGEASAAEEVEAGGGPGDGGGWPRRRAEGGRGQADAPGAAGDPGQERPGLVAGVA